MFGLGLLSRLASRFGFSPIPLYLVVGLAFGDGGIYHLVTADEFIRPASTIGVVLLLLVLGLEYSATDLIGGLKENARVGVIDLVINAIPGLVAAWALGFDFKEATALAGVTTISSSGIVAKLLDSITGAGKQAKKLRTATVSILVIEDLAVAIYLPVLSAMLAAGHGASGVMTTVVAFVALGIALFVALKLGHGMSVMVASKNRETLLLTVLGLAMVIGGAAEKVHISAAVGAFMFGLALSEHIVDNARKVLVPLRDLFAAAFFVLVGLRLDPSTIPGVLPAALGLAIAGFATKLATGWLAAHKGGLSRANAVRLGAVLVARGEFSILIATIGVEAGLSPKLESLTTTYVMITAVLGSIAPRLVGSLKLSDKPVRRVKAGAESAKAKDEAVGAAAAADTKPASSSTALVRADGKASARPSVRPATAATKATTGTSSSSSTSSTAKAAKISTAKAMPSKTTPTKAVSVKALPTKALSRKAPTTKAAAPHKAAAPKARAPRGTDDE